MAAEVEERRCEQTSDDEDQRSGHLRRDEAQPEDHGERREPDEHRRAVRLGQPAEP